MTHTLGWANVWQSAPSVFAVAARTTDDVVAAVNFARKNNLRLVVKGGGHSYQGTSCAPDSLLVWMRDMDDIALHGAFVASGCAGHAAPHPAVTIGADAIWMHVYNAVTTRGARYVQGGGCATVGRSVHGIDNFDVVKEKVVLRGGQPSEAGLSTLKEMGVAAKVAR